MTNDIEKHSQEFDLLTQARHEKGSEEYGDLAFLGNDMYTYIYEELADAANYLRYQFIKLRILEEQQIASGIDLTSGTFDQVQLEDELSHGTPSFSPSEEVQRFFPTKE